MDIINIFEVIILSSLIGSLILLMTLIIKRIFGNVLNPTFHYYIWIILLIKLIMPFGPQTPLNISNISERLNVQSMANAKTQQIQLNSFDQPKNKRPAEVKSLVTYEPSYKNVISNASNIPLINEFNIENMCFYVWMFGIALLIIKLLIQYKNLREIVRTSVKNML
jgi:bla regulator protein BlaR1